MIRLHNAFKACLVTIMRCLVAIRIKSTDMNKIRMSICSTYFARKIFKSTPGDTCSQIDSFSGFMWRWSLSAGIWDSRKAVQHITGCKREKNYAVEHTATVGQGRCGEKARGTNPTPHTKLEKIWTHCGKKYTSQYNSHRDNWQHTRKSAERLVWCGVPKSDRWEKP